MTEEKSLQQQIMVMVATLSLVEKIRLAQRILEMLGHDLDGMTPSPRRSLLGVLADTGEAPSAAEIDEARREMWGNFPRDDIA